METKIEIVDDMLSIFKTESSDLSEFLEDTNEFSPDDFETVFGEYRAEF